MYNYYWSKVKRIYKALYALNDFHTLYIVYAHVNFRDRIKSNVSELRT